MSFRDVVRVGVEAYFFVFVIGCYIFGNHVVLFVEVGGVRAVYIVELF